MTTVSKMRRLLFISPWFLCTFLIVPLLVIVSISFKVRLPLAGPTLLLANNTGFGLLVLVRLARYLSVMKKKIRYGTDGRPDTKGSVSTTCSAADIRQRLQGAGYHLSDDGLYGERPDTGFIGVIICYGGLLVLLATGTVDNLYRFSGVLLDGMGPATDLNKVESYRQVSKGPLSAVPDSLPKMRITEQLFPDSRYPRGATMVRFVAEDGAEQQYLLIPGTSVHRGRYDISMTKLVFEPQLVIRDKKTNVLFDSFVPLHPLVQKRGVFSFYGPYIGKDLVGGIYYQPERSLLMVVVTRDGKRVVTDLQFQVDQQVAQGEYLLSCAKMGQWSEIHVVRRRHTALLWFGGLLALSGLILRLAVRPQRFWLAEHAGGCRVCCSGKEARSLIEGIS